MCARLFVGRFTPAIRANLLSYRLLLISSRTVIPVRKPPKKESTPSDKNVRTI
jgi:hypothetical protein